MSHSTTTRRPGPGRPPKIHRIPIADLILLPKSMRPRVTENREQIDRYTHDMQNGDTFPPVIVYKGRAGELGGALAGLGLSASGQMIDTLKKDDIIHVLADGYHRLAATLAVNGQPNNEIRAIVKMGSHRDAQWEAFASNHLHGLPLTNTDKRKIVTLVLDDKEWKHHSARAIAEHCHVSSSFVDEMKKARTAATTAHRGQSDRVIDKRGREMQTAKIGTTRKRFTQADLAGLTVAVDALTTAAPSRSNAEWLASYKAFLSRVDPECNTSDGWLEILQPLLDAARQALGDAGWNRFVNEARALLGTVTVDAA